MKNIKNFFLKKFCFFLKKFQKKVFYFDKQKPKILIVSTTALGDSLWSTCAIASIKKKYKNGLIALLTSPIGKEVFENNKNVNKIFVYKNFFSLFFLFFAIKKYNFQVILNFHSSQRVIPALCFLQKSSIRIASKNLNKGLDLFFTKTIENKNLHEIERRFEIIKEIGVEKFEKSMNFYIKNTNFLKKIKKPFIILHPGAANAFKRWPFFDELGKMIFEKLDFKIIITGTLKEKKFLEKIAKKIPNSTIIFPSCLNELAVLIKKSNLLITNDTGPLHLSIALNKKSLSIFGATDPKTCGPYFYEKATVITGKKICEICKKKQCQNPICLSKIPAQKIFDSCKKIIC